MYVRTHMYDEVMDTSLMDFLNERYAPLRNVSDRTLVMMQGTITQLSWFLNREPMLSDLTDITMARFLRWRAVTPSKRGKIVSPATVAKDRCHLVGLANLAAKKRLIAEFVDFPRVKVPIRPPRAYTSDEITRLIQAARRKRGMVGQLPAPWFWGTLIYAEWLTGERCGGLLSVRWEWVDLEQQTITVLGEHRKDGTTTIVRAIDHRLTTWMRTEERPSGLVWPWIEHRRHMTSFYSSFRWLCRIAGVQPRGTHAIRKASGSYVHASGGDATDHLGHQDARVTRRHYLDPRILGRESAISYLPPLDLGGQSPSNSSGSPEGTGSP